jgi:peptide chain release factor 3
VEILRRVKVDDPMKSKHLKHSLGQLAEEEATHVFKRRMAATGSSALSADFSSTY